MGELRALLRHSAIYGVGSVVNRAAGLILLPLYLHVLPADEFGLYALVVTTAEVVTLFAGVGLANAVVRLLVDEVEPRGRGAVVGSALAALAGVGVGLLLLAVPAGRYASSLALGTSEHATVFAIAFATVVFAVVLEVFLGVLRAEKRSGAYTLWSFAKTLLFLALNLVFLLVLELGVLGIVLGGLLANALVVSAAVSTLVRRFPLRFRVATCRRLLGLGAPLVPAALLDAVVVTVDRYVLAAAAGPAVLGVYAVAHRLVQLLRIGVALPFAQIWTVRRLEAEASPPDDASAIQLANAFNYFLAVLVLSALALALFTPELLVVIARAGYADAAVLVGPIAVGFVSYTLKWHFEIGLFHAERTVDMVRASAATAAAAVPVYLLAVHAAGALGAAIAFAGLNVARTALTAWFAARRSRVVATFDWPAAGYLLAVVATGGAVSAVVVGFEAGVAAAAKKSVILAAVVIACWFGPAVGQAGREELPALAREVTARLSRRLWRRA